jgi:asparagine synthase (glutamine-hydrolysing)
MCGIAGVFSGSGDGSAVRGMLDALAHRGPDDSGVWLGGNGLEIGQRRLSIIDLSPAGHQPMASHDGRFQIVFNGEIYNYQALRRELESIAHRQWRGTSDTEVLLAAFEAWGVSEALARAHGMFALAAWDEARQELVLARDRFGEKPLYFGWIGTQFAFASEMKAFAGLRGWSPRLSPSAIAGFLDSGYVQGAQSAVQGIWRLPPGSVLRLPAGALHSPMQWDEIAGRLAYFWRLADEVGRARAEPFTGSVEEAVAELAQHLRDAVAACMVADVPVGAFLSGGIDSTAVVATMQRLSPRPVKTFSIGFEQPEFDEAPFARAIAAHLGTEHHELYVGPRDALGIIPQLARIFDEPFADQSQLPTLLVSRLAGRHVKVSLSGDAGDELFGGYGRYAAIGSLWRGVGWMPAPLRMLSATAARGASKIARAGSARTLAFRIERLADRVGVRDIESMRRQFIGGATRHGRTAGGGSGHAPPASGQSVLRRLMLADQLDYLTDDILVKLDRASMAASLESRVPLLAPALVRFSWRLPDAFLNRGGIGKIVLREVLATLVPPALWARPKQGFAPPVAHWLRSELRDWAEALLEKPALESLGVLDAAGVLDDWRRHQRGDGDYSYSLWNVLMLLAWKHEFGVSA